MTALLDDLIRGARRRARELPSSDPMPSDRRRLDEALRGRDRIALIAELKRRSPGAGDLEPQADATTVVRQYVAAGAAAISVLTEPTRFGGSLDDLAAAAATADVPLLMKDFVVDRRQIEQGCAHGASGVLLLARCLDDASLAALARTATDLGMTPLVETHDVRELDRALAIDGAIIGVNNRDLDSLAIDREVARRLLPRIPPDRIAVAESGYATGRQVATEVRGLADAVLVGTALMRRGNAAAFLEECHR